MLNKVTAYIQRSFKRYNQPIRLSYLTLNIQIQSGIYQQIINHTQQDLLIDSLDQIKCRKHNEKIILFSLEDGTKLDDRLLCSTCLETIDASPLSLPWSKAKQTLQRRYQQLQIYFQTERDRMIQLVMSFKSIVDQIKVELLQTLDEIGTQTALWISNLEQLGSEGVGVSQQFLLEELVKIAVLKQESLPKLQQQYVLNSLSECNYNFESNLKSSFRKLLTFDSLPKLVKILGLHQQDQFHQELKYALFDSLEELGQYIIIAGDYLKSNSDIPIPVNQQEKETIIKQEQVGKVNQSAHNPITYQLVEQFKQDEYCCAVAFNNRGTIMVENDIKIWNIEKGRFKATGIVLPGHTDRIFCIVFSQKSNWFASSGRDYSICCWKEIKQNNWVSSQPVKQHKDSVYCLILNGDEDQLLSCGGDKSIKVWKVDHNRNELTYDYSLDKHTDQVLCINFNESETLLVSCSFDKSIIIWGRGQLNKWEFKYKVTKSLDDYGKRICFINDSTIAWQQCSRGITHIFKLENGMYSEKPELQITLNKIDKDGDSLFSSMFNRKQRILIQKHNKYVYIIREQNDGKFKVESSQIDCNHINNFGGLTGNGEYLVVWNCGTKQLRLYRINYE